MRVLKKLKSNYVNKNKIFGFDIETHQVDRGDYIEQKFLMGSVVGDGVKKIFEDKNEMSDFISNSRTLRNNLLFATNLDFDFRHSVMKTDNYKDFNKITTNGNIIYACKKDKDKHSWKLLDTANFTGRITVKKMGNQLGIPKLPQPKCFKRKWDNEEEKNEMVAYNVRDSYISQQYAKFLQQFFNSLNCRMKLTIASTGLDNWRRHGQPKDIFPEREEWIEKHYLGSFRGGRTEVFKRGYVEDVYCFDYNSMYPGVCKDGFDGFGSYPNPSSAHYIGNCDEDIIKNFEGITNVSLFSPDTYMPMIGVKSEAGKLIFPKGVIKDKWLTNVEIRQALKNGYELLSVGEGIYYTENFVPFKKLITDMYALRQKYKREGNTPMEQMIKTMMNSGTFGKFCQRLDGFEEEIHKDNVFSDEFGNIGFYQNTKFVKAETYIERGDCLYIKKKRTSIPLFTLPILSSYTTALSRLKFHKDFSPHHKYLCYGDTDSGHFTKNIFSHSTELGELGFDYKLDQAIYIKPKLYYGKKEDAKEIFKSKGIGKFINSKEKWNRLMFDKVADIERFTKYKESCVRKIPFSSIIKMSKHVSLEDDKRDWFGKKFSHLRLCDSDPIEMNQPKAL